MTEQDSINEIFLLSSFVKLPNVGMFNQLFHTIFGTLFMFGFIAMFLKYFNAYSPKLSYLMDASYWIYIVHLPIVVLIQGLLAGVSIPYFHFLIIR